MGNPRQGGGPRTVVIDANVIEQIGRGNQQAANAMRQMMANGTQIYVTQQSYNEMVIQPAIPRTGVAKREFMTEMNIQIAPPGNAAARQQVIGANNTGSGQAILAPGDLQVAAHANGIGAEVWSFDRNFRNNAGSLRQTLGVNPAQECAIPLANGQEDFRVARRLSNLPPIEIDFNGNITRPGAGGPPRGGGGGGGGGGGLPQISSDDALTRFNNRTANIQGIAGGIQMLQQWASQQSAMNTYYEALAEIEKRSGEIETQQKRNPYEPVIIKIFYKIDHDNLPAEMPRFYHLISVEIGGESLAHGDLLGPGQKGYTVRIPALQRNPAADAPRPAQKMSWQQRYDSFVGSLVTRSGNVADPEGSLSSLNGLAMFDILPILKKLKQKEPLAFDKLQQALDWPSVSGSGGTSRLRAAFVAVRASDNAGAAVFANYVASCRDYGTLPSDQQKDVEKFLSGGAPADQAMDKPTGKWKVRVKQWTWIYTFDAFGNVSWVDPANGKTGKGNWVMTGSIMQTTWLPSSTVEDWKIPLTPHGQIGLARMDEGSHTLTAEMVD